MNKVFVGGSRRITRLNKDLRERLDALIKDQAAVLVGDANGADKAVQMYFHEQRYPHVLVFCTAGNCRNNLGRWPIKAVTSPHRTRDFEYFTAKDAAMAGEADFALMLWDGQSSGTLVNVARMVSASKRVVLYLAPEREFVTLQSREDLEKLLASCSAEVRDRVGAYIAQHAPEYVQPSIF